MYYIKYKIKNSSDFVIIVIVRLEILFSDVVVVFNFSDERYKYLEN